MTKDVLLTIRGLQMTTAEEEDTMEMYAAGEYYYRNGKHFLKYEEAVEGFAEPNKNMIKASKDYMELTKNGPVSVHMVFEKAKKNITYYQTPYGSLQIGIDATRVDVIETEEKITIEADYALEMNCEHVANCSISVVVVPKTSTAFKLV